MPYHGEFRGPRLYHAHRDCRVCPVCVLSGAHVYFTCLVLHSQSSCWLMRVSCLQVALARTPISQRTPCLGPVIIALSKRASAMLHGLFLSTLIARSLRHVTCTCTAVSVQDRRSSPPGGRTRGGWGEGDPACSHWGQTWSKTQSITRPN